MRKLLKKLSLFAAGALVLVLLFNACSAATTTASLGFVVGTGADGGDKKLHRIVYPGQSSRVGSYEKIWYVPANSRNYLVNDGTVKNANGEIVGDRQTLIVASTKNGTTINIWASAFWMLNQSREALANFYNVCFKYQCWSENDIGGTANYSTKGWNGMLGENFGPALDGAARIAAIELDDSIWQTHDPKLYQALADGMSNNFASVVRARLGYREDLFCGSQNSAWEDPGHPEESTFNCTPVRVVVERVERGQVQENASTQSVKTINAQRLENAQAIYGSDAGFWLGLQDTIEKCKTALVNCIVNIGGSGGGPAVSVPANNPAPMPTPTPAKR